MFVAKKLDHAVDPYPSNDVETVAIIDMLKGVEAQTIFHAWLDKAGCDRGSVPKNVGKVITSRIGSILEVIKMMKPVQLHSEAIGLADLDRIEGDVLSDAPLQVALGKRIQIPLSLSEYERIALSSDIFWSLASTYFGLDPSTFLGSGRSAYSGSLTSTSSSSKLSGLPASG